MSQASNIEAPAPKEKTIEEMEEMIHDLDEQFGYWKTTKRRLRNKYPCLEMQFWILFYLLLSGLISVIPFLELVVREHQKLYGLDISP